MQNATTLTPQSSSASDDAPVLTRAHLKGLASALGVDWSLAERLVTLVGPYAHRKAASLKGADLLMVASALNLPVSPEQADKLASALPQFLSNPEATIWDFVTKGGLPAMLAGVPLNKPGDFIRRCPHCDGLLIPLFD